LLILAAADGFEKGGLMAHKKMCALTCCCCSVEDNMKKLKELMHEPKFICSECGHAANDKEFLCHPKKY
jgi:hypothetical protein